MEDDGMLTECQESLNETGRFRKPLVLGVTGGIASGKSSVIDYFDRLGADVLSADQLAREAVLPGSLALAEIRVVFGDAFLLDDGTLDREKMAAEVFADPASREKLEKIVRPSIAVLAGKRLDELRQKDIELVVYEAPLLFEAAVEGRVDRVLTIWVRPDVQLQRLCRRNNLTEDEARQRILAQFPQEVKVVRADELLDNSGSLEQTWSGVELLFKRLVADR
ncbi:MAG: dephospho-CoA kinase [Desulfuromonas sp.]|nr:MAG: dephospho-CoA kinase [Desulfuromonas sp.]